MIRQERKIPLQYDHRTLEIVCTEDENGIAAGELLRKKGFSHRLITRMKRTENGMTRNGTLCRTIDILHTGDVVVLKIPAGYDKEKSHPASNGQLKVSAVYEDDDIIVYNKPSGMPVHESALHRNDTLSNYFAFRFPGLPFRGVNRLDRDTSGLCLAAKNRHSANISQSNISKVYYAVCQGDISEPMRIEAPIARERESMIKRVVREDGKYAATVIKPIRRTGSHTLLEIHLETGRTHQIRVHMAHIGHPLAGDTLYGGSTDHISRQALHCGSMSFVHPVSGELITVTAPLPEDISGILG